MTLIYIAFCLLLLWIGVLTYYIYKVHNFFGKLTKIKSDNLNEVLRKVLKNQDASKKEFSELFNEITRIDREKARYVQGVGFVKYKAFGKEETENSFSVAFLDQRGNGIVVTSIQLSDRTRVFAKEIIRGRETLTLSNEEKLAIARAMKL